MFDLVTVRCDPLDCDRSNPVRQANPPSLLRLNGFASEDRHYRPLFLYSVPGPPLGPSALKILVPPDPWPLLASDPLCRAGA